MSHLQDSDRIVILAHEKFPHDAKTAVGILRYGEYDVAAILDKTNAGKNVHDFFPALPDAPIVNSFDDVQDAVDALLIGIAPHGGGFTEGWRPDISAALDEGCDIISGLHYSLNKDSTFAKQAAQNDATIYDVREPSVDLELGSGRAASVDCDIIVTAGTDGDIGKMTTSMELVEAARNRGIKAGLIPTGQTGIMIAGWGIAIDKVPADFVSGAIEQMILKEAADHELLIVEGQGSINHPAYSADCIGILHGAMADQMVLVHEAGRHSLNGFDSFAIPPITQCADIYEQVAKPVHETNITAGSLNTSGIESESDARSAVDAYSAAIDAPATDIIRFGPEPIIDALV